MSGITESWERYPVIYEVTGDKALIIAWYVSTDGLPYVVLCLEDGRSVGTRIDNIKFDYRYDNTDQVWVDVSKIPSHEEPDADADQAPEDDGGPPVS